MERLKEIWDVYGTTTQTADFLEIAFENGISFTTIVDTKDENGISVMRCTEPDTDELTNIHDMNSELRKKGWKTDRNDAGKVIFRKR